MIPESKLIRWKDIHRKLPYGKLRSAYRVSEDSRYVLVPIPEEVILWEQAFDYLDQGSSLREVCEWISQKLKVSMVHQTVSNMYKLHRKPFLRTKTNRNKGRKQTKETREILSAKKTLEYAQRNVIKALDKKHKIPREEYDIPPEPKERKPLGTFNPPPVPKEVSIIFQPNPGPQKLFLASTEEEVLYGGAAGGEPKSWFLASFLS